MASPACYGALVCLILHELQKALRIQLGLHTADLFALVRKRLRNQHMTNTYDQRRQIQCSVREETAGPVTARARMHRVQQGYTISDVS